MKYTGRLRMTKSEFDDLDQQPELIHLYNATQVWADLKTGQQLYEALKAIFDDNCFYHKSGDERAYRLATEAINKAEGR